MANNTFFLNEPTKFKFDYQQHYNIFMQGRGRDEVLQYEHILISFNVAKTKYRLQRL